MAENHLRVNRTFTAWKQWSWVLVVVIAFGGLVVPRVGLLLLPIMLGLFLTAVFRGKYWCGNLCPHASLFDQLLLPVSAMRKIPSWLRSRPFAIGFFTFFMVMFVQRLSSVIPLWGTMTFWDRFGFVFSLNYLMPTVIGSLLAVTVNSRAWCTFCPMGTMQLLAYKLSKRVGLAAKTDRLITMSAPDQCRQCARCAKACPMQLAPYKSLSASNQFEDEACIRCAVCVEECPLKLLSLESKVD